MPKNKIFIIHQSLLSIWVHSPKIDIEIYTIWTRITKDFKMQNKQEEKKTNKNQTMLEECGKCFHNKKMCHEIEI